MQINKIDSNMNFQALKVNKKTAVKLAELPFEEIESWRTFGESIKDIKLFNVHLLDDLTIAVKSVDASDQYNYFALLHKEEKQLGRHYSHISYDGAGETEVGGFYPDQPRIFISTYGKNAKKEYEKFKKLGIKEQAGELSRLLENREFKRIEGESAAATERIAKEIVERKAQEQKDFAIKSLLDEYGCEEDIQPVKEAEPKKAKSFFKRLFH